MNGRGGADAPGKRPETAAENVPGAGKRWVTLFPPAANVHMLKDVGMIPFVMHREYGYDATLVCFRNEAAYPAAGREAQGLRLRFLEADRKYRFGRPSAKVLAYLREHAREIDVLNLYHATRESLVYGWWYKRLHPSGLLYIKLDLDADRFAAQKLQRLRLAGYRWYFRRFADIVSCELPSVRDYLSASIPLLAEKLLLLPNGVDGRAIRESGLPARTFGEKENLILTVGRIGAPEKNHEMLLRALARVETGDWRAVLAGPVDPAFGAWLDRFFREHPRLREKVVLTGEIRDRNELYGWYDRAKVFCLTSRYESFGLVLVEALRFGLYVLTTPVRPAAFLTDGGRLGKTVGTEEELAAALRDVFDGRTVGEPASRAATAWSERFDWTALLQPLDERIRSLSGGKEGAGFREERK